MKSPEELLPLSNDDFYLYVYGQFYGEDLKMDRSEKISLAKSSFSSYVEKSKNRVCKKLRSGHNMTEQQQIEHILKALEKVNLIPWLKACIAAAIVRKGINTHCQL